MIGRTAAFLLVLAALPVGGSSDAAVPLQPSPRERVAKVACYAPAPGTAYDESLGAHALRRSSSCGRACGGYSSGGHPSTATRCISVVPAAMGGMMFRGWATSTRCVVPRARMPTRASRTCEPRSTALPPRVGTGSTGSCRSQRLGPGEPAWRSRQTETSHGSRSPPAAAPRRGGPTRSRSSTVSGRRLWFGCRCENSRRRPTRSSSTREARTAASRSGVPTLCRPDRATAFCR